MVNFVNGLKREENDEYEKWRKNEKWLKKCKERAIPYYEDDEILNYTYTTKSKRKVI
jgi:hypothetical protein